uniref:Myb-like domain-containing protein n=1 Tax=Chenopodium quinoa TaxID=63459 RepID=A0A803NDV7_CHEQI
MISCYCKQQGVKRGPAQCKKRWSNLIGDFRKVKNWESKMEGGDDDEVDEEDEKMQDGAEVLSEIKNKVQETLAITGKLDDVKSADNVTEEPVKNFCIQEPISESRPNFSNEDSQGKGKRQRLSTDECKANCSEEQLLKVLEENNRLLNAQLESHNKNCQLEREQRKQNYNELMSTLSKLTDVLSKIAEKL